MLLGNKKSQSNEQNWCIILNPLRSELDKKKVAQKIADAFTLSTSEATDLVANTPIILLDNLTRQIAGQIKDYFSASGAEVALTNDVVMKRKCYRTVWPEPPSLSFLNSWGASEEAVSDERLELAAQEALEELRTIGHEDAKKPFAADFPPSGLFAKEKEKMMEELELWRQECLKLREEVSRVNAEVAQHRNEKSFGVPGVKDVQQSLKDKDREIQEARQIARLTQEKYDAIREEYREAQTLFEEKVTRTAQDNDRLKLKFNELNESIQQLQKEKQSAIESLRDRDAKLQKIEQDYAASRKTADTQNAQFQQLGGNYESILREKKVLDETLREREIKLKSVMDEYERYRRLADEKQGQVAQENESFRIKLNELSEKLQNQAKEKEIALNALKEREALSEQATQESLRARQGLESQLAQARRDAEQQKKSTQDALDLSDSLKRAKENLERAIQNGIAQIGEWREKYSELTRRFENAEKSIQDEQRFRAIAESREKELERNQIRLLSEIESKNAAIRDLEIKVQELESQAETMHQLISEREKVLNTNLSLLESREAELESARRQLREINSQMEHRETVARKNQVTSQLVEKESEFKRLISEQEKIEREIRDKEEAMRQVLSRQEAVEKEIIEAKQVQRHLMERFKQKEKPSLKIRTHREHDAGDHGQQPRDTDSE